MVIVLCAFDPLRETVSDQEQQSGGKVLGQGRIGATETKRRGTNSYAKGEVSTTPSWKNGAFKQNNRP